LPSFPVYSIGFVADDKVVLGGGGGAGRSGIKNKLRLYNVTADKLDLLDELELDPDEDAPMTMAVNRDTSEIVCGINSAKEKLKAGDNQNCRVYGTKGDKIERKQTTSTLKIVDEDVDDYQKVTTFSESNRILAVGCTNNQVSLLAYPTLAPISDAFDVPKSGGDVFDIDFFGDYAIVTASKSIYIVGVPSTSAKETSISPVKVLKSIEPPSVLATPSGTTCAFRGARVVTSKGKDGSETTSLFAIVNTTPPRSAKGAARTAYICVYTLDASSDEVLCTISKTKSVSSKAVTVFDVSADGQSLGIGSSDLSVTILDAKTLAPLVSILNAHEFPPTALRFNLSSSLLVSGSADNSVRVISVPSGAKSNGMTVLTYILLAVLAAILAVVYSRIE